MPALALAPVFLLKTMHHNDLAGVPVVGMFVPIMGIHPGSGHTDPLFSPIQQRLLGILFGAPDRPVQSAELIRVVGGGTGATHRQLIRLADAGLITMHRIGSQKFYQANRASPIFTELRAIVRKTFGLVEPLREVLAPATSDIAAAFVYGSIADGTDTDQSDIDLMVLSATLSYGDVFDLLQPAERELGRTVHPTVVDPTRWRDESADPDTFLGRVARGAILPVLGAHDVGE